MINPAAVRRPAEIPSGTIKFTRHRLKDQVRLVRRDWRAGNGAEHHLQLVGNM